MQSMVAHSSLGGLNFNGGVSSGMASGGGFGLSGGGPAGGVGLGLSGGGSSGLGGLEGLLGLYDYDVKQ